MNLQKCLKEGMGERILILFLYYAVNLVPLSIVNAQSASEALSLLRQNVHERTLSNGMRVLMYRRGIAPVFSAILGVRVGSSDEVPGQTGISHLFEHMAFKGTRSIGSKDYEKEKPLLDELEKIAASTDGAKNLSGEMLQRWRAIHAQLSELWIPQAFSRLFEERGAVGLNASTGPELTQYYVSLPRSEFEFWCKMEADFLRNPVMRQFYQERDVVREEQRSRTEDDPMGRLLEQFYGTAFLMHPYRQPVIGYVSDIERLSATKLEAFRSKYYVPSNMVMALVGDVDPERDGILLEKYFGEIPKGKDPERPKIEEREQDGERRFTVQFNSSPELLIGYKKPNYPHPDDAPITVMLEVLSGGKTSLLYRELVEKKRLATVVEASEVPGSAYPNLAVFFAEPANPHSNDKLLEEFDRLIGDFRESQVNEEDIKIAKRALSMSYLQTMRSNNSLAGALLSSELLHGDWMATLAWYEEAMKVSSDDIKRVANTYLRKSRRTVGMLEKKMEVEK